MARKVTKKIFLEAIENNEDGLTNLEIATNLGISEVHFYRLRKKYENEILEIAKEMLKQRAINYVNDLTRQSREGKTEATKTGLEILGIKKKDNNGLFGGRR